MTQYLFLEYDISSYISGYDSLLFAHAGDSRLLYMGLWVSDLLHCRMPTGPADRAGDVHYYGK